MFAPKNFFLDQIKVCSNKNDSFGL